MTLDRGSVTRNGKIRDYSDLRDVNSVKHLDRRERDAINAQISSSIEKTRRVKQNRRKVAQMRKHNGKNGRNRKRHGF